MEATRSASKIDDGSFAVLQAFVNGAFDPAVCIDTQLQIVTSNDEFNATFAHQPHSKIDSIFPTAALQELIAQVPTQVIIHTLQNIADPQSSYRLKISTVVLKATTFYLIVCKAHLDVSHREESRSDAVAALAAAQKSETLYRSIMESLSEGVVVQSETGAIQACNQNAQAILGLSEDQILGRTSLDPRWRTIYPDHSPFPGDQHPAMITLRTGIPCKNVVMGVHKPDGSLSWIRINAQPLTSDQNQQVIAVVATFTDISNEILAEQKSKQLRSELESRVIERTDQLAQLNKLLLAEISKRRQTEEVLSESEERLRLALAAAKMQTWDWHLDLQRLEQDVNEFLDHRGFHYEIHPEDRGLVIKRLIQTIHHHCDFQLQFRTIDRDELISWVEVRGSIQTDLGGKPERFLGIIQNINEQKQAEQLLQASENRYRQLADSLPQIVVTLTPRGQLEYFNKTFANYCENASIDPERSMAKLIHPADLESVREAWRSGSIGNKSFEIVHRVQQPNGKYHWHLTRFTPLHETAGEVTKWYGTSIDIEYQMQAEEIRAALLHKLVVTQEDERKRIARELHDQTGQLLAALKVELRSLEGHLVENEIAQSKMRIVRNIADSISKELRDLILDLRPAALDEIGLSDALEQYVTDWASRFGINVDFHSQGFSNFRLFPNIEIALYRVVQEALTNILKHAEATVACIVLERNHQFIKLIIEDNGKGFDPVAQQAKGKNPQNFGLLGMKERILHIGGMIEIESQPSRGTSLFIRIPLTQSPGRPYGQFTAKF